MPNADGIAVYTESNEIIRELETALDAFSGIWKPAAS
jgi:hypothetical protein